MPLRGPPIRDTLELGPWWYYVLAAPLAVTRSLAATVAIVLALAALKYLLAWLLGRRIGGPALGLAFVVAMLVPLWSAAPLAFPTHTAFVETAMLALGLVTLAGRQRFDLRRALTFGLAAGACVHAHPSTVLAIATAGVVILSAHRSAAVAWRIAISAGIALASLLPPLLAQDGATALLGEAIATYAAADLGASPFSRAARLMGSIALGGAWHGAMLLWSWTGAEGLALAAASFSCGVAALGLAAAARARDPAVVRAGFALAMFAGQALFLATIRPFTTVWMASTLVPPFAFALACGWEALVRRGGVARAFGGAAIAASFVLGLSMFPFFVRELDTVRVARGGNLLMDAAAPWAREYDEVHVARIRLRRLERAAAIACTADVLHGDLAAADERSLGLPTKRACPERATRYGGSSRGAHLAGYASRSWCSIGLRPDHLGSGLGYTRDVLPIGPAIGATRPLPGPRQVDPIPQPLVPVPFEYVVELPARAVVVVTNRYLWLNPLELGRIEAGDRPAELLHAASDTNFYRCVECSGERIRWLISGRGGVFGIDVVALFDSSGGTDPCVGPGK